MSASQKVTVHITTLTRGMKVVECNANTEPHQLQHLLAGQFSILTVPSGGGFYIWHMGPVSQWGSSHVCMTEDATILLACANIKLSYNGDYIKSIPFPTHLIDVPEAVQSLYRQLRNEMLVLPPVEVVSYTFSPDGGFQFIPTFSSTYHIAALPPYSSPLMHVVSFTPTHHCPTCKSSLDRYSNCLGGEVAYKFADGSIVTYPYRCPPANVQTVVNKNSMPVRMAYDGNTLKRSDNDSDSDYDPDEDCEWDDDYEAYSEEEYANGKTDWDRFTGNSKKKHAGVYHPLAHFQEFVTSRNGTENVVIPPGVAEEVAQYLADRKRRATTATVREALGDLEAYPWTKDRYGPYYFNAARIASIINHGRPGVLPDGAIPKHHNDMLRKLYLQFHRTWCDLPEVVLRGRRIMPRANILFYYLCNVAADLYKDPTWLTYLDLSPTPDGGPPRLKDEVVQGNYAEITREVSIRNNWAIVPL